MSTTTVRDETVRNVKKASDDIQDDLHDAANQAGRKVRGMIDSAGDEVSHVGHRVSKEIHANPVQSSLIALGVGVVLGALLRR